jgi:hypothetical protein
MGNCRGTIILKLIFGKSFNMSEQEKYEKLKKIAMKMAEDKKIIDQKGTERAAKENGIKFFVPQSLSKQFKR